MVRASLPLSSEYGTNKPDSGLSFQVKVLETFRVAPFSLGSGKPDPNDWRIQEIFVEHVKSGRFKDLNLNAKPIIWP